jgi:hypothetical protein
LRLAAATKNASTTVEMTQWVNEIHPSGTTKRPKIVIAIEARVRNLISLLCAGSGLTGS